MQIKLVLVSEPYFLQSRSAYKQLIGEKTSYQGGRQWLIKKNSSFQIQSFRNTEPNFTKNQLEGGSEI